ncbi:hypothetical protein GA0070620_2536 [Micromonospora krabiensis]|uniref:Uncharacterized protein n=1 Tax=Micromonospora krabiensis TaxID=307121 RepID=A0A1C3N388_9ACTN|nr:hypothetical protein GA0070620_2536 [Micromonospora krabiensis]
MTLRHGPSGRHASPAATRRDGVRVTGGERQRRRVQTSSAVATTSADQTTATVKQ